MASFVLTRLVFLKALAFVYFLAFASLLPQLAGLVGENGIQSIRETLGIWRQIPSPRRYYMFPTLVWLDSSDTALKLTCLVGMLFSLLALAGIGSAPAFVFLWILYLTIVIAGQEFLSFQWDTLLLETGFLAIFLAPWSRAAPSPIAIGLLWWLLFRLMFESGVVKLSSRDQSWRDGRALHYHYYTQPLPNPPAWYFWQLPGWTRKVSVWTMFLIEIPLPFLIFAPAPFRYLAAGGLIFLQLLIAFTGNYGFFNLLSIVLCLPLLDDKIWAHLISLPNLPPEPSLISQIPVALWAAVVLPVSVPQLVRAIKPAWRLPRYARSLERALRPMFLVNPYGLFRVMTTLRPEIRLEGSNDGKEWREYVFRYKPSDLKERPRQVAPHMPRLDWQMWFAALSGFEGTEWFGALLVRIFQNSPAVLSLFRENPFPEGPPKYLRARLYDFVFTTSRERRDTKQWWRQKLLGAYCPTFRHPDRE